MSDENSILGALKSLNFDIQPRNSPHHLFYGTLCYGLFFKPEYHSLVSPHPILWTPRANPHEVCKAVVQLKMLSGRYRIAALTKHWGTNRTGCCPAPGCSESETLPHLLLDCPHYNQSRAKLRRLWKSSSNSTLLTLLLEILDSSPTTQVQFILDASVNPKVILLVQTHGQDILLPLFHLTRTWCYTLHRERRKLLGGFIFE